MRQVEDNQSSLMGRTARSIVSESMSQLSVDFDFDNEIITTEVYREALRSTLKKVACTSAPGAKGSESSSETTPKFTNDGVCVHIEFGVEQFSSQTLEASRNSLRNLYLVNKLQSTRLSLSMKKRSSGSSRKA